MIHLWDLPEDVQELFAYFHTKAAALFLVGGAVRDLLRGVPPGDYDFTVNVPPDTLLKLLQDSPYRIYRQGELFGTIGVILNHKSYEITSFRKEDLYLDNRHPEVILFTPSIEEDLARRDFTINAIAWSPMTGLIDPYGGQEDLLALKIRAVGDPRRRMAEDALRILRAIRFSASFEAEIEPETSQAMEEYEETIASLSCERIGEELLKLFKTEHALEIFDRYSWAWKRSIEATGKSVDLPIISSHEPLDPSISVVYMLLSTPGLLRSPEGVEVSRQDVLREVANIYRRSDREDLRVLRRLIDELCGISKAEEILLAWSWPEDFRREVLLSLVDYLLTASIRDMDIRLTAVLFSPERLERLQALRRAKGDDLPGFLVEEAGELRAKLPLDQADLGWSAEELMAQGYEGEAIREQRMKGLLLNWELN